MSDSSGRGPVCVAPVSTLSQRPSGTASAVVDQPPRRRRPSGSRVATVTAGLGAMGAGIEGGEDRLTVRGGTRLAGTGVHSHDDHRIAMALAVAGLAAEGDTTIDGWECVRTSYPGFEEDLERCAS